MPAPRAPTPLGMATRMFAGLFRRRRALRAFVYQTARELRLRMGADAHDGALARLRSSDSLGDCEGERLWFAVVAMLGRTPSPDDGPVARAACLLAARPSARASTRPMRSGLRLLLLGGCQVAALRNEVKHELVTSQLWRFPTIALMSAPVSPAAPLGFDDRHSRYVLDDCAKAHLATLLVAECDILVFEIVRDVRCPLIRIGQTYLFDPNQMYFRVPDAPLPTERSIDVAEFLGRADIEPLDSSSPGFFETWAEHFDRFYQLVLRQRISNGCIVIVQELYLAKQTDPPSAQLQSDWDYCDACNALLRRMYANISCYPGIAPVGLREEAYVSSRSAPFGGPNPLHPIRDVFVRMADQLRAIVERRR